MTEGQKPGGRMIHVRLPEDIHRELRIRAAEEDTTIQAWVSSLVAKNLKDKRKHPKQRKGGMEPEGEPLR